MHALFVPAIAALALSLTVAPANAATWVQYDPVLRVGTATGWKNILLVFWSHREPRSAWMQREILRNLTTEVTNKDLTIMLYQIAGPDEGDIQEASVFLCVPKGEYGTIITRYLDLLASERGGFRRQAFQRMIARAGAGLGLPRRLSQCWTESPAHERVTALNVHRDALGRHWPHRQLPHFILNGEVVNVRTVNDIRSKLLKQ